MMKARTLPSPTSMILGLGLLVLGWVFFPAPPALSQTQDPCQLPPDTTHPPDPPVTAQQVEDGSASLMDFALVARDETKKVSLEGATNRGPVFHLGCLVRQEGGPWRSGLIYTLKLTSSGRLLSHAKEMALSGGLLDRVIYAEILSALGVSPTDVADLASPDSTTAARAQEAVLATLSQEPHAAFDATEPVADVRPGISGALRLRSRLPQRLWFPDNSGRRVRYEFISPSSRSTRLWRSGHYCQGRGGSRNPEVFRHGSRKLLGRTPRDQRPRRRIERQDYLPGSERALDTRSRVPLRLGYDN